MEESAHSHFWVARLEPVRPTLEPTCRAKCTDTRRRGRISAEESALEPLNKEDARMVEDQAGEENVLKTRRQPRRPSEQEVAAHEAGGHYPYRDWCRACICGAGRSDAHQRHSDEQNEIPVAATDYAFFCDEHEERLSETQATEIPKGATPFLVIRVRPCMMTWSFPV